MRKQCLVPGCTNTPLCRGLCRRDYGAAFRLVEAGETTWDQLIAANKALPKQGARKSEAARNFFLAK